ncbi:hypothetical protein SLS62_010500 [Diatrype stigma]|uniref:Uncharacterized protein n=1 Tax=Diatrype stigma TaxID=117547 RepID=A0AAN9YH20_9PEZI
MKKSRDSLALTALLLSIGRAQDVVYVTDLSIFTVLAPCAASAVAYNVQSQTYANCPEDVDALQSCVCTKDNNFASISKAISQSVSYSCGGTASEDQSSAATVLDAYCKQDEDVSFPEPATPVSLFVTDLPAFAELAPCAASGLASMTYDLCPGDASHLATCVCNKNQNSLLASQGINTSVRYSCASNTADVSSAQAVFAGYCGLNNGTSSFPKASGPPGDSGPQALASCVCLKNGMSRRLTNLITSSVKYSCDSTASEDISSAIEVFDYYCSAANALVTPADITESVTQTARSGSTVLSGPTQTAEPTSDSGDFGIGGSGSGSSEPDNSVSGQSNPESTSGSPGNGDGVSSGEPNAQPTATNIGVIVGAVVGVVGGLVLIGVMAFFIWHRSRKAKTQVLAGNAESGAGTAGKPELDSAALVSTTLSPSASPSPNALKTQPPSRVDNVSPISAHHASELNGQNPIQRQPHTSELHAQSPGPQLSGLHAQGAAGSSSPGPRSELSGQDAILSAHPANSLHSPGGHSAHEALGQQVYEAPVQHPAVVHEMHAQPVPISQHYEMDGGLPPSRAPQ